MTTVSVAVPRKGRPLEAVLERLAAATAGSDETGNTDATGVADDVTGVADDVISTLRYEKAVAKGTVDADGDVYERLAQYSDLADPTEPEFSLLRDDRDGRPRRVVFDSLTVPVGDDDVQLIGREEPFRALRTHEFALGFDSADLVLEEVVTLEPDPLSSIEGINERIDPRDTDVRVVAGMGDTVHHTLLATAEVAGDATLDREFVTDYAGDLCISPRYERLVEAVLGTDALDGIEFVYASNGIEEERSIAESGLGVYLTVTGSTAREHDLVIGERLFPSETVLLENPIEDAPGVDDVRELFAPSERARVAPTD